MIPSAFEGETDYLGAPPGVSPEECEPLSIMRGDMNGTPVVISCWKMTREELDEVNKTGRVWLMVWGVTMPPACLCGIRPFSLAGGE